MVSLTSLKTSLYMLHFFSPNILEKILIKSPRSSVSIFLKDPYKKSSFFSMNILKKILIKKFTLIDLPSSTLVSPKILEYILTYRYILEKCSKKSKIENIANYVETFPKKVLEKIIKPFERSKIPSKNWLWWFKVLGSRLNIS